MKNVEKRLFSKLLTSQSGKQTISMHILPDISRSKGNQTMQFGQLIEYGIFLEKSCTKCGAETIPRPFSKKSKLISSLKFHTNCFDCMPS